MIKLLTRWVTLDSGKLIKKEIYLDKKTNLAEKYAGVG